MVKSCLLAALFPPFLVLASALEHRMGFIETTAIRSFVHSDVERGSCLSRRHNPWTVQHVPPADLRTLHVRSYHGNPKNSPALDSTAAWNNDHEKPALEPAQVLERLRQEREKYNSPLQRLAERLAPQDDMANFKLNWVGDIDRHQRKLFWMLIQMLCDKIAPILWACRAVHDFIIATQEQIGHISREARNKWIPALALAARVAALHAAKGARIAAQEFVLASIATIRAGYHARAKLRRRRQLRDAAPGGEEAVHNTPAVALAAPIVSADGGRGDDLREARGMVEARGRGEEESIAEVGGRLEGRLESESRSGSRREEPAARPEARAASRLKRIWNQVLSVDIIL